MVPILFDDQWVWVRRTKMTWEQARDLHERMGHVLRYHDMYMVDECD